MPKKPSSQKKTSKKAAPPASAAQIQHYNAILIEDLKSEFRFVVEHMSGIEQRLTDRMDKTDAANNERFDNIEAVLKIHSQMLQENSKRWEANEKRMERIETKLDNVIEKVERHDQEISELKSHLMVS